MRTIKSTFIAVILCTLCFAGIAGAQDNRRYGGNGHVQAGTMITVRTNEDINVRGANGRVYMGAVEQDVRERDGDLVIPAGSPVELMVKRMSNNDLALDLESVSINGERYALETQDTVVSSNENGGLGANKRTGEYVGGGAILGAIIGAIAGGGKGAAIGAGAGAAAGAGTQVLTRGNHVSVPAESLLTFELSRPLRAGVLERGYLRNGTHYHSAEEFAPSASVAYRDGWQAGRSDWDRGNPRNLNTRRWTGYQDRRDYQTGYNDGYQSQGAYNNQYQTPRYDERQKPSSNFSSRGSVNIGNDKNISWSGPENSTLYVQLDNLAPQPFAMGASGVQPAPWINRGHLYTFILKDASGVEIARSQQDLR